MITDLNKILVEWAYRISDGKPDVSNKAKLLKLETVLYDFGWSREARAELLNTLIREDDVVKNKKTGNVYTVKNHNPETQDLVKKNASKDDIKKIDKAKEKGDEEKPKVSMSSTIDRGGDSEVKNLAFKYGFKEVKDKDGNTIFKPAPGNAGSLLNEIVSGEVAQMLEENPNLSDEELIDILEDRFGKTELFKSKGKNGNSGSKLAGGLTKKDIDVPKGRNVGLYSKLFLAVKSGRRKHNKALDKAEKRGFKNPKMENYYGHSSSFDAMVNDIKDKQVIGPNGEEISQEEAEELIRSGGGGDNPSDTATLVFDGSSNKVIMLFHSDKDSTDAIVAQSSANAEAVANEKNVDRLVKDGKITEEQAEAVKGKNRELVDTLDDIEKELKQVVTGPGKWFQKNVEPKDAINSIKNDKNTDGSEDKNKTSTKWKSVVNQRGELNSKLRKYLPDGVDHRTVTDEQALDAFLKFMADEDKGVDAKGNPIEPTDDQVTLMERLNSRFVEKGAPDIFTQLEDIRNRTLQAQRDFTKDNDEIKIDVDGKEVGLGTFLEGGTVWKQFHLEAANSDSKVGVHKYPGMFETNHAGLAVDGETLVGCMGGDVKNQNDFVTHLEVGDIEEQKGVSGTQKGLTTGGKRLVYAITAGGEKIEIGQKTMRTKRGKTGKLATDYKWSKDMKDCFSKKGKK